MSGGTRHGCATWGGPQRLKPQRAKFPRRSRPDSDRTDAQLYTRFPALLILSDLSPASWDFLVFHRAPLYVQPRTGVVFRPPGVVRFKEGVMQVLGWTIVLLCQWILRKVSSYHDRGGEIFTLAQRCALCVWRQTPAFSFSRARKKRKKINYYGFNVIVVISRRRTTWRYFFSPSDT